MFNRNNDEDLYTPEREDKNKQRKKIALIVFGVLAVIFIGYQILKPNTLPGGTAITRVDKTGQTPGVSMHTPREQQAISNSLLEEVGPIPSENESGYANGVTESIQKSVEYVFYNLVRDDNPKIDGVDSQKVLSRMADEKEERWAGVFYDEYVAFELTQLYNLTLNETHSPEELSKYKQDGVAAANPREAYATVREGIQIEDITPKDSPFYVMSVRTQYKSETSVPVEITYNVRMSKDARIFDIEPLNIAVIQPGE